MADAPHPLLSPSTWLTALTPPAITMNMADTPHTILNKADALHSHPPVITLNMAINLNMADAPHPLLSFSTLLTPLIPLEITLNMADTSHITLNMADAPALPSITLKINDFRTSTPQLNLNMNSFN